MQERRQFRRLPIGLKVLYTDPSGPGAPTPSRSEDISLGGIRLIPSSPLPPGQELSVTVDLPFHGRATLQAAVVWCQPSDKQAGLYRAGLRWLESLASDQARLNAFITQRLHSNHPTYPGPMVGHPLPWWRSLFSLFRRH